MEAIRIGIVGTGFIARGLYLHLRTSSRFAPAAVLTRRPLSDLRDFPATDVRFTHSVEELVDTADVVFECSGDVNHAADVATAAAMFEKPMVTLNAEFHVTCGSAFVDRMLLTEAEGDQPGCEAALVEDARAMGFRIRVVGNMKRFLDPAPNPASMREWAGRFGLNPQQVTAFTDGTKLHIEQVLVANGLGCELLPQGMNGITAESVEQGALALGDQAVNAGLNVSDYVLCPTAGPGVFVVAEHAAEQKSYLSYLRLGDGPLYYLKRDYHLCHLEALKTVTRVVDERRVLINNSSSPRYSVAAVAKRPLEPWTRIAHGIGSDEMRGVAVAISAAPKHIPIGLVHSATVVTHLEPGQMLEVGDLELPESPGTRAWLDIHDRVDRDHSSVDQGRLTRAQAGDLTIEHAV